MWLIAANAIGTVSQWRNVDVKPAKRAGRMVMPLGQDGLKHREVAKAGEVDPGHARVRLTDCGIDVEIAAGINGVGAKEVLEDDDRPGRKLVQHGFEPRRR